jgi:hypothetical protein
MASSYKANIKAKELNMGSNAVKGICLVLIIVGVFVAITQPAREKPYGNMSYIVHENAETTPLNLTWNANVYRSKAALRENEAYTDFSESGTRISHDWRQDSPVERNEFCVKWTSTAILEPGKWYRVQASSVGNLRVIRNENIYIMNLWNSHINNGVTEFQMQKPGQLEVVFCGKIYEAQVNFEVREVTPIETTETAPPAAE